VLTLLYLKPKDRELLLATKSQAGCLLQAEIISENVFQICPTSAFELGDYRHVLCELGYSIEFLNVMRFMHRCGYDMVRFAADGGLHPDCGLPADVIS
jgi:hypothetical protein